MFVAVLHNLACWCQNYLCGWVWLLRLQRRWLSRLMERTFKLRSEPAVMADILLWKVIFTNSSPSDTHSEYWPHITEDNTNNFNARYFLHAPKKVLWRLVYILALGTRCHPIKKLHVLNSTLHSNNYEWLIKFFVTLFLELSPVHVKAKRVGLIDSKPDLVIVYILLKICLVWLLLWLRYRPCHLTHFGDFSYAKRDGS